MKTYLNYSQKNNIINNSMLMRKHKVQAEQKHKTKLNSRENIELNRPARAISFGGSAGLNKVTKLATKAFNGTVEFVNDNEAAYNAIYSLIVAGMLKPLFVLNMPGSEEKDKQIVATKNFLQAFLGSFLSLTIGGGFIKKAIDVFKTNKQHIKIADKDTIEAISATSAKALEIAKEMLKKEGHKNPSIDQIVEKAKIIIKNLETNHIDNFRKNPQFLKNMKAGLGNKSTLEDASEVLWKNSTGALTAILKAKISSLLLPGVMAFLFAKKNLEKEMQKRAQMEAMNKKLTTKEDEYKQLIKKGNKNVSFEGNLLNSGIDGAASLIEKAAMSKVGEKMTEALSHAKKPSARMSDIESIAITAYWLQNTARSKKIEPSQKLGLNIHSALVTVVSSTFAFFIDWALDGLIDNSKVKYKTKLENIVKSIKENPALEIGETLDSALKDAKGMTPVIKMGIKDKVVQLLDSKTTKEGIKEITDDEIKSIVESLRSAKSFEGFELDENLIKKAIESLKKSEPIRKDILKQAEDMIGTKDIARSLSRAIGDNDSISKEISKLTATYGKKLSKFKSLTVFTLVVRFLVPVLMVPFSGKLKKKIIEWTDGKPNKPEQAAKK